MSKKPKHKGNNPHTCPHEAGSDKESSHGEVKVRGSVEVHSSPQAIELRNAEREGDKTQKDKEYFLSLRGHTIAKIACVATILYLFATILIFWQTKKAAEAAQASVELARLNAHLDQRAWIGIGDIRGIPQANQIWEVVIVFHNSGKTFAKNFRGVIVADPESIGSDPQFDYAKDEHFLYGVVPPGGDTNARLNLVKSRSTGKPSVLAAPLLDSINRGDLRIYAHGQVLYDDIFGKTHWLTYCYFWNPENRGFVACQMHNDTGDDEMKK